MNRRLTIGAALLGVSLVGRTALALDGHRRWSSPRVVLTPSADPPAPGVSSFELRDALRRAARAWSYPEVPCTAVEVRVEEPAPYALRGGGANVVVFRAGAWCHDERCGGLRTFPEGALAMTTALPVDAAAPITGAEIELNAVTYEWSAAIAPPEDRAPLAAILAHEIGHALGFGDACVASSVRNAIRVDEACADRDSIMFVGSERTALSALDAKGLCAAYPRVAPVAPAAPQQTASRRGPFAALVALAAVAALVAMTFGRRLRRGRGRIKIDTRSPSR